MTDFPATIEACHARLTTARQEFGKLRAQLETVAQRDAVNVRVIAHALAILDGNPPPQAPPVATHPLVTRVQELAADAAGLPHAAARARTAAALLARVGALWTPEAVSQGVAALGKNQEWIRLLSEVRTAVDAEEHDRCPEIPF